MTSRSRCCADYCGNNRFRNTKFTFHPFPKDPEVRKRWLVAMGKPNWEPPNYSVLCSAHFTEDSYQEILGRDCLKRWAVPSLFSPFDSKSPVKGYVKKPLPLRPKGILRGKSSLKKVNLDITPEKFKIAEYKFSPKSQNQNETPVIFDITEDDPVSFKLVEDVEMSHVSSHSRLKSSISSPKAKRTSFLPGYSRQRNACVQTENIMSTKTVNTQTVISVPNADEYLDDSVLEVESLRMKVKVDKLLSHIHLLQNNLIQKEKEVEMLLGERNELSSRLNEETMIVVERAFKEVLHGFLNDDHSSIEKFLMKCGRLCLNTNISFVKSVGNSDEDRD